MEFNEQILEKNSNIIKSYTKSSITVLDKEYNYNVIVPPEKSIIKCNLNTSNITKELIIKNISNNDSIPFIATFNYVEGINNNSEVQLAGIKIGDVNKIKISPDGIIINGYIESKYNIPEDSIVKIKSEGIFGRKALSIEPGFGEYLDKSNQQYVFNQTQDSYSVDMFLRYLNDLNE